MRPRVRRLDELLEMRLHLQAPAAGLSIGTIPRDGGLTRLGDARGCVGSHLAVHLELVVGASFPGSARGEKGVHLSAAPVGLVVAPIHLHRLHCRGLWFFPGFSRRGPHCELERLQAR